jgi:hypothetical protein
MRAVLAMLAGLIVLFFGRFALADDAPATLPAPVRFQSASTCTTDAGNSRTLPPGTFFAEPTFDALDTEIRRLQEAETRLTAENEALKAPSHAFRTVKRPFLLAILGFAGGVGAGMLLVHERDNAGEPLQERP